MEWLQTLSGQLPILGLVCLRSSGLFLTAPFFGQQRVPVVVRVLLSVTLGALILPFLSGLPSSSPPQGLLWAVAGLQEVMTGALYGWASTLIFEGLVLAGQLVGLQMGFAQANVLNPDSQAQRPLLSEVYFILSMLVFLSLNGHHMLIRVFEASFTRIPLGQLVLSARTFEQLTTLFAQIFGVGLIVAAPICGVLTLIDIIMGVIARTAPQMNILVLSFSIKIYVGLLSLLLSLVFLVQFLNDLLPQLIEQLLRLGP
ncbi:MAG: flagellar biosynthetic protein FliR [Candidatus Sericytochromatia bacterium]